jgi:hypothetical protein
MKTLTLFAALAACTTSSNSGSADHVSGTIGGSAFTARDAIWKNVNASGFDFNGTSTIVMVSEFPSACSVETTRKGVANGRFLAFALATTDSNGAATPIATAGKYTVNPSGTTPPANQLLVEPYYEQDDGTCLPSTKHFGMSGSVTVTSTTDPIQATFDVTFDNGEHITGSFDAVQCGGIDPNSSLQC